MIDTHPNVRPTDCDWCGKPIAEGIQVAYVAGELACPDCLKEIHGDRAPFRPAT